MELEPQSGVKFSRVGIVAYARLVRENRNFRRLWLAQIVSEIGDWFYTLAIYNLLLQLTGRASSVALALVLQVLPWPFHKDISLGDGEGCKKSDGIDIGMICSISIPLITLCALILLMIIVTLLDFIFRWLPWFVICFPVPGLKGKKIGGSS